MAVRRGYIAVRCERIRRRCELPAWTLLMWVLALFVLLVFVSLLTGVMEFRSQYLQGQPLFTLVLTGAFTAASMAFAMGFPRIAKGISIKRPSLDRAREDRARRLALRRNPWLRYGLFSAGLAVAFCPMILIISGCEWGVVFIVPQVVVAAVWFCHGCFSRRGVELRCAGCEHRMGSWRGGGPLCPECGAQWKEPWGCVAGVPRPDGVLLVGSVLMLSWAAITYVSQLFAPL